jgi:hypothetical protein
MSDVFLVSVSNHNTIDCRPSESKFPNTKSGSTNTLHRLVEGLIYHLPRYSQSRQDLQLHARKTNSIQSYPADTMSNTSKSGGKDKKKLSKPNFLRLSTTESQAINDYVTRNDTPTLDRQPKLSSSMPSQDTFGQERLVIPPHQRQSSLTLSSQENVRRQNSLTLLYPRSPGG